MWLSFRVFGGSYIWNEPPSARLCFQSSGSVLLQDCIKYLVEFSAYPTALRSSFLSCYITWVIPSRNLYFSLPWYISLYWSECFMYRKTLLPKKKKKKQKKENLSDRFWKIETAKTPVKAGAALCTDARIIGNRFIWNIQHC